MEQVGFIGLGMMGAPMAHRLHEAGFALVVQDANASTLDTFVEAHPGTRAAADPEAYARCEAVITMLPNSDVVEAVLDRVAPQLAPGTMVIDMSSSDPGRTRALAGRLADRQIVLLDAPVSGGVNKALSGTLAIMAGGDLEAYGCGKKLLAAMGTHLTHVGPVGAGHALKALNNYVSMAALIATAEAIHAGCAFGIDLAPWWT